MKRSSRRKLYQELKKKLQAMQEEDQSNSSPCKSISPEEEKHDFFTTLSKGKKCDQSSDNIWKIELTRYLESKKTDDLTCLNFLYNVL
jgi:hypothetical protein